MQTVGAKFPVYALEWAVCSSNLEIVKLVYDFWKSLPDQGIEDLASKGRSVLSKTTFYGSLEIVQWLLQTIPDCLSFEAVSHAVSSGDLDFLRLVLEKVELTSHQRKAVVETAISYEKLAVVKYQYERWPSSFKVNEECLWEQRDYDLAKYLHMRAGVLMASAITDVISYGKLDLVRFYLPHSPTHMAEVAVGMAARDGHLDVVQFLHQDASIRCTPLTIRTAVKHGRLEVFFFLYERNRHLSSPDMMDLAATRGHLRIVQFLHEQGETCTTKAMDDAALGDHLHVVQFLHQHRTEGCTRRAMNIAIIRRDFSLVQFLHENRSEGYDVEVLDALDEYRTPSGNRIVRLLAPDRPMDDNSRRMRLEQLAKNPLQGLFKEVDEYDDDTDSDLRNWSMPCTRVESEGHFNTSLIASLLDKMIQLHILSTNRILSRIIIITDIDAIRTIYFIYSMYADKHFI